MKLCTKCNQLKDESEFSCYRSTTYKLRSVCKQCENKRAKEYNHHIPCNNDPQYIRRKSNGWTKSVCKIIKDHHEEMKDDPERLTTKFIQKIVRVKCD